MPTLIRLAGVALVASGVILAIPTSRADSAPAATRFYPFLGTWHGHGQLTMHGQPPAQLTITVSCRKAAAGWAVQCAMHGGNKQMTLSESDLMAVNTTTGETHWYGVTNQGEADDFLVTWPNAHTMHARYAWMQHGKHMQENVVFKFTGKRTMTWRTVDTSDGGRVVSTFSGSLVRR